MQQARCGSTVGSGGQGTRTLEAVLNPHNFHARHAVVHCQPRLAVELDGGAQLASRQRHNHHEQRRARGLERPQQEVAHGTAAAVWVLACRISHCRQGRGRQEGG
mgnify:CR=1 FL=1